MNDTVSLTDHFLIAMPRLQDSNFYQTVTYLCEHNSQGAMGIVINRPTELRLNDILDQLEIDTCDAKQCEQPIYAGGPVQTDRGFVLHDGDSIWDSTLKITPEISVTTSKDILQAIARGDGPAHALIALGYAGWGEGQLERELGENTWLDGPADQQIIFDLKINQRWKAAAMLMGVDLNLLSDNAGHA
ncbi:MAG: YqgE/AlgH family protein [Gammaproteobacteria bacterium]|nr:YqgE/AlgH family protein [Gammaproteobacteria bacterium]